MSERPRIAETQAAAFEHLRRVQELAAAQLIIAAANTADSLVHTTYPWGGEPHVEVEGFGPAQSVGFDI